MRKDSSVPASGSSRDHEVAGHHSEPQTQLSSRFDTGAWPRARLPDSGLYQYIRSKANVTFRISFCELSFANTNRIYLHLLVCEGSIILLITFTAATGPTWVRAELSWFCARDQTSLLQPNKFQPKIVSVYERLCLVVVTCC